MTLQLIAPCFLGLEPAASFRQRHPSVNVCIVADRPLAVGCSVLVYPKSMTRFSYPRACNFGIRHSPADIVVIGPVDTWWSAEALAAAHEVKDNELMAFRVHRVTSFARLPGWSENTNFPFLGGYAAARASTWATLRGFNERMAGWGGDDLDLYERAGKLLNTLTPRGCPVWDLDHADNRAGHGWMRHGLDNFENQRIGHEAPWHELPESADWGTGCFS